MILTKNWLLQGAIDVQPQIVMIEKRGIIFFRIWAGFILKKGAYGNAESRLIRVQAFQILSSYGFISGISFCFLTLYILIRPFRKQDH